VSRGAFSLRRRRRRRSSPPSKTPKKPEKKNPKKQFGTPAFLELHHTVEQLALQAHHNAATHSDEFVADLLCSHQGRLGALVKGLLAAEAWRERVFEPHLRKGGLLLSLSHQKQKNDDDNNNSTTDPWVLYCALRHEAAIASLLELCLFRAGANGPSPPLPLLLSEGEALELADWCVRRLRHLALLAPMAGSTTTATTTALAHPIARVGAWRRELMARATAAEATTGEEAEAGDDNADADDKQQQRRVRALAAAARALLDAPPELELEDRVVETEFQAALPALGLTRWLADAACCCGGGGGDNDNASPSSLALLSRLVGRPSAAKGDDAVTLLAQLLDRPPWERGAVAGGGCGGGVERYCCGGGGDNGGDGSSSSSSSSWTPVAASERHRLAPQAAQAWLALCRLLCEPAARARWLAGGSGARSPSSSVAAVLRLRRPLASPLLLDQAPFLVSLARVVEGLAMMANGSGGGNNAGFASALSSSSSSAMMMMVEPLPGLRDAILAEAAKSAAAGGGGKSSKDWARAVAEAQARGAFSAAQSREAAQTRAASVAQAFEHYCLLAGGGGGEGEGDDTAVAADAASASSSSSSSSAKKATETTTSAHVTCWRQAGCDLWEPWGDFVCRVDAKKKGEEVAVKGAGSSSSSPPPTRGLRRRLLPLDAVARPFPCEGKVAVRVGDRVAEARVSLPALHGCRDDDGEGEKGNDNASPPAVVWVSVGDLARDGFVLQLRLARVPPAKRERDRASGHWYGYAPAAVAGSAGALTIKATGTAAASE
jgi:hypothetical protein